MNKTLTEAIDETVIADEYQGVMGAVMADAYKGMKVRRDRMEKAFADRKKDMPNEDRFAHSKVQSTNEMKKMHLSESAFELIDVRNRGKKNLREGAEKGSVGDIAKFIEKAVNGLLNSTSTNYRYKLDDRLAVFVGWSSGYGDEKRDDVIQDKNDLDWGINAGIKVWTSDDMWTDFDYLNFPYYENGDIIDNSWSIVEGEDYNKLAKYILDSYNEIKDLTIEEDGRIVEDNGEVEESIKRVSVGVRESFLNETGEVDSKKCADILNNWVDWVEVDETGDVDFAIEQLRSLKSEGEITDDEYDFIMKNWDDLLVENMKGDNKKGGKKLAESVRFGQSSLDELLDTIKEYYRDYTTIDAIDAIFSLMNDLNEDETYKLVYAVAERVEEFVGEELEDSQKYPIESPFEKEERKGVSVQADQKYPVKPSVKKKDSQFVKAEQKAPVGLSESKKLEEEVKIITDIWDFEPWSHAVETFQKIKDAGKLETLDFMLEDMYPEGLTATQLNDLLWFDDEWILSMVGLGDEENDGADASEFDDGDEFINVEEDGEVVEE